MTLKEKGYWVALSMAPEIGPKRFQKLIAYFGNAEAAWNSSLQVMEKFLGHNLAAKFEDFRRKTNPLAELEKMEKKEVKYVLSCDSDYPPLLSEIYDQPPVLYYKGRIKAEDLTSVAVIGSRSATPGGLIVAEELARGLAECGITVVSGLARGIDSAAHRGTLKEIKGRTLAVLGSGLDRIYPPENKKLAEEIIERGALCSEFPLGTSPVARNFPARNRIISGLSLGVTVVEATEDSGSLITVDFALEQGRDVFAVPGPINKKRSKGTNRLIKEGAYLVDSVEDIIEVLGISRSTSAKTDAYSEAAPCSNGCSSVEKTILSILSEEEYHVDMLIRLTGYPPAQVGAALIVMEMKGLVSEGAPGVYYRCK